MAGEVISLVGGKKIVTGEGWLIGAKGPVLKRHKGAVGAHWRGPMQWPNDTYGFVFGGTSSNNTGKLNVLLQPTVGTASTLRATPPMSR